MSSYIAKTDIVIEGNKDWIIKEGDRLTLCDTCQKADRSAFTVLVHHTGFKIPIPQGKLFEWFTLDSDD